MADREAIGRRDRRTHQALALRTAVSGHPEGSLPAALTSRQACIEPFFNDGLA